MDLPDRSQCIATVANPLPNAGGASGAGAAGRHLDGKVAIHWSNRALRHASAARRPSRFVILLNSTPLSVRAA